MAVKRRPRGGKRHRAGQRAAANQTCGIQLRRVKFGCSVVFGFNTDVKFGDTVYHVQSEVREHDSVLQTQVFVKGRCIGKYASSFAQYVVGDEIAEEHLHDLLKAQHKHFVESARAGTVEEEIENGREAAAAAVPAMPSATSIVPAMPPEASAETEVEERISLSFSDDADLAAIAEASAAVTDTRPAQPVPPPEATEMPVAVVSPPPPVEAPPDPMLDSFMAELEAAEKEPPPPPLLQYRVEPAGAVIGKGLELDCLEPIVSPDGGSVLLNVTVSEQGTPTTGAQVTCRVAMPQGPAAYVYANSNEDGVADVRIATHGLQVSTGILIQASMHSKSVSRKFNLKRS